MRILVGFILTERANSAGLFALANNCLTDAQDHSENHQYPSRRSNTSRDFQRQCITRQQDTYYTLFGLPSERRHDTRHGAVMGGVSTHFRVQLVPLSLM